MKTYWISLYLDISNKDNLKKYGEKAWINEEKALVSFLK